MINNFIEWLYNDCSVILRFFIILFLFYVLEIVVILGYKFWYRFLGGEKYIEKRAKEMAKKIEREIRN